MASETFPFAFNGDRAFAQAFAGRHTQSVTLTVGIIGNHQSCLRMSPTEARAMAIALEAAATFAENVVPDTGLGESAVDHKGSSVEPGIAMAVTTSTDVERQCGRERVEELITGRGQ